VICRTAKPDKLSKKFPIDIDEMPDDVERDDVSADFCIAANNSESSGCSLAIFDYSIKKLKNTC